MKISEVMTRDVKLVGPQHTLGDAAKLMAELDIGVLPVANSEKLIGMITDRDITVRGVARGLAADAKVEEAMTADVKYCYEDDEVEDVLENMGEIQIRRLPVLDSDKKLVGIVSLGDLAVESEEDPDAVGDSLAEISRPGA